MKIENQFGKNQVTKSKMIQLIKSIPYEEDDYTRELFLKFKSLKKLKCLTKEQLIEILKWKSPRPLKHYYANSEESVKEITTLAFATKNDKLKIHILTALNGVNYPSASSILMFYNPQKYPVLDIRVWQQLYKENLVDDNSKGKNFTLQQWGNYITVIRDLADELNLTAREVEKRLFDHDKITRTENLY